jgi:hypothetical protein
MDSVVRLGAVLMVGTVICLVSPKYVAAAPSLAQQTYASPEDAAAALAQAARARDQNALRAIFGPGSEKLLASGDRYADDGQLRRFVAAFDEKHALMPQAPGRMELEVGADAWPLPIPIVEVGGRWQFDTRAGAEEIVNRRIGRDELAAIRVLLAYTDAQKAYFAWARQKTGAGEYAQRLVSRAGQQDGLYWPVSGDGPESPFGPLLAQAQSEGYPGEVVAGRLVPYQGYFFRVLKAQGPDAPGGARSYLHDGRMTGGYALLAWPAGYGASGIMTFQVNQDGIVFQKDLGPETARLSAQIAQFDPDLTWARVEVTNQ